MTLPGKALSLSVLIFTISLPHWSLSQAGVDYYQGQQRAQQQRLKEQRAERREARKRLKKEADSKRQNTLDYQHQKATDSRENSIRMLEQPHSIGAELEPITTESEN